MNKVLTIFLLLVILCPFMPYSAKGEYNAAPPRNYFELIVYHTGTEQQMALLDSFLQQSLLPALHKTGISKIGVFKPLANDTATDKKVYVLVPYKSWQQYEGLSAQLAKDKAFETSAKGYANTPYDKPAYTRYETMLLKAFEDMPGIGASALTGPKSDRVYELRSYESSSEKLFRNKVDMFNKGGEVKLFDRLGFNAVFYGEVLFGSRMPNLMYMTSFKDKASRDEHWKTFGSDPTWKELSAKPEYQHNVSKNDIVFLRATNYSDL